MSRSVIQRLEIAIACEKAEIRLLIHERDKYARMTGLNGPNNLSGADYSPKPKNKQPYISLYEAADHIAKINKKIQEKEKNIAEFEVYKADIYRSWRECTDIVDKVYYQRYIFGLTQEATANKLKMSVRQIQRIDKKIKEKGMKNEYLKIHDKQPQNTSNDETDLQSSTNTCKIE